ncbi:MAG: leucine-rich repeat protein [Paludibacteraceae bacterium]
MKRKTLFFLLGLLFLVPLSLRAYDFKSGDLYYNITSNTEPYTVEVTYQTYATSSNYSGLTTATIPETVTYNGTTYSVTSIGYYAFYYCGSLTSVTIPESVTSIGDRAFYDCDGLTSVTIPESVMSIGKSAFSYVFNVIYQGTATGTPWGASHMNCYVEGYLLFESEAKKELLDCARSATGEITIPNSVMNIGDYAFAGCRGLTSVTIPNSVTSIGNRAFQDCSGFLSITIPENVTSIGGCMCDGCTNLISVHWNAKNCGDFYVREEGTSIVSNIPFGDSQLTAITFGDSVEYIPACLCYEMSSLTSVTIPENVTSIGQGAFLGVLNIIYHGKIEGWEAAWWGAKAVNGYRDGCLVYESAAKTQLLGCSVAATGEIIIPNSVTSIGERAFYDCSGLTSIAIPNSVTRIKKHAFYHCSHLTSITIPEGVKTISTYAFYGCSRLTSVVVPKSIISLQAYAFYDCSGLTSITIPKGVKSISAYAFYDCSDLSSITIPDSVTSIEQHAFDGCTGLTSVTIPESVTRIGTDAFRGCDSLTSIVSLNTERPFLSNSLGGASNKVVIVPHSAVAAYQSARYWKDCNISSDGFDINVSTTLTKAKITASYLGNTDSVAHRFGCIFGNDTVWQINMADSIVWQLEKLTPDSVYQFCLCKENGIPQKYAFRTKSPSVNIDILNITQTTATMRFAYDFGDVDIATDVDCIQGHFWGKEDGDWRLSINTPRGTIDTTFTHLHPGAEYSFYVHAVLKNGVSCESISRTYTTLPVSLGTPNVSEYGQTYATINCDYNCGDAIVIRNVLEFRLSAEEDAAVVVTENVTGAQTKVTNLLPNTTYYFRHVLEIEGCDAFIQPLQPAQIVSYDFESNDDNAHWHFINGTQSNKWVINTDAGSDDGGTTALYVSSGTSYSYSNTTSTVWAYCDDILSGTVTISFDRKGTGESSCDYMYAYLVPVNVSQPTAGSTTIPDEAIQIGSRFNSQSSWTTFTDQEHTLVGQYRLYFMWHNDGSINGSPIAIDNVAINIQSGRPGWQEFTTKPITLTTQEADGISNTSVLLHGMVDCDQESYTEIGFEWKRSDAPATVKPQRLLVTDRVDENLLFRLEGLSSDRYYDFRTFCSYQGETYYGEWVGLLTSDKEVLVAPTVQTVGATANEQGAEMEGFIVTGTEPILQKGFEVWIKGGTDVKTTVAEGRIIRALIPEPWSYTTYQYKAYAKTASGTTYGETMEVTTGYIPRDVQDIAVTPSSNSAEVTWTEIEVADYYILTLFADEAMTDTIAVYQVGTDGSISRLRMPSAVKALVTCSIEDLTPATDYYFAVVAYNSTNQKVAEESGTFATEPAPTGIRPTTDEPSPAVRKILYRGQVLILRGDKVYTLMGQEARR